MANKRKPRYWIIDLDAENGGKVRFGPSPMGHNLLSQLRFYVDIVGLKNCIIVQEVQDSGKAL